MTETQDVQTGRMQTVPLSQLSSVAWGVEAKRISTEEMDFNGRKGFQRKKRISKWISTEEKDFDGRKGFRWKKRISTEEKDLDGRKGF